MKKIIILLEGDPQQSREIKTAIERYFSQVEIEVIETEKGFRESIASIAASEDHLCLVIADTAIRWAFPERDGPNAPADVKEGTHRGAGIRCWQLLRQQNNLSHVSWIYFTTLSMKAMEFASYSDWRTGYVEKGFSIKPLIEEMMARTLVPVKF